MLEPLSDETRALLIAALSDAWFRLAASPASAAEAAECRALLVRLVTAGKVILSNPDTL